MAGASRRWPRAGGRPAPLVHSCQTVHGVLQIQPTALQSNAHVRRVPYTLWVTAPGMEAGSGARVASRTTAGAGLPAHGGAG